jgi:hypothetical protein
MREIISKSVAPSHSQKAYPHQQIICNLNKRVTRSSSSAHLSYFTNTLFVAIFNPQDVRHALSNLSWVKAMHEELENFERNQVWTLVEPPRDVNVIGTKWIFCRHPKDRLPPRTIFKSRQRLPPPGLGQLWGRHVSPRFISHLLTWGSSGAATCPHGSGSRLPARGNSRTAMCHLGSSTHLLA